MNDVFLLVAFESDGSAFLVLGVYRFAKHALDILDVTQAIYPGMQVKVLQMPVDRCRPTHVQQAPPRPATPESKAST